LPGLKTVVAVNRGRSKRGGSLSFSSFVVGRIEKPFDIEEIHAVISSFPVECV
jgi:hypothetical protein